ncbi:hypothetical protein [Streptomyces sp. NPDC057545]|uniref:hypothetical protein n=1 Tax=unclassified Streptomyces TaxID=2593676 RepID=UPI0036AFC75F
MRARIWLTGAALGAALLTGGTVATAQAAPAPSEAGAQHVRVGSSFPTQGACESFGRAGVYSDWYCQKSGTKWYLWVDLNS